MSLELGWGLSLIVAIIAAHWIVTPAAAIVALLLFGLAKIVAPREVQPLPASVQDPSHIAAATAHAFPRIERDAI